MKKEFKSFNGMTNYLMETPFRRMMYTIYNYLSDEGVITFLENSGYSTDIESLEYLQIKTDNEEKNLIKKGKSELAKSFCHYINDELQSSPIIQAVIMKEYGAIIVIKPITVSINRLITGDDE